MSRPVLAASAVALLACLAAGGLDGVLPSAWRQEPRPVSGVIARLASELPGCLGAGVYSTGSGVMVQAVLVPDRPGAVIAALRRACGAELGELETHGEVRVAVFPGSVDRGPVALRETAAARTLVVEAPPGTSSSSAAALLDEIPAPSGRLPAYISAVAVLVFIVFAAFRYRRARVSRMREEDDEA